MYYLVFSLILAQIVSLYKTKSFHKSQQCGRYVFHFATYLVYIYKTYWPNPPKFLDTIADGIILQQLGHLTFPIICDLVEKDVFTLVSIYIYMSYIYRQDR
jgi:hypothetical protein